MEFIITLLVIVGFALWLWLPFAIFSEIKNSANKDKGYKAFRIKTELADLKQKIKSLEQELREYEESTGDEVESIEQTPDRE